MKQLTTEKLGMIAYEEGDVIFFPQGLFGFEESRHFILIRNEKNELFFFLQSIDDPKLMFILINPKMIFSNYEVEIHESEVTDLDTDQLIDFSIVTIPNQKEKATVNLLGPIIIDVKNQIGKQVVSLNQEYTTKQPLILKKENHPIAI